MTKFLIAFALSLTTGSAFSQLFLRDKDFVYGKMIGEDTLVGYFHISREITSNGQSVTYKRNLDEVYSKCFPSRKYSYFVSDSLYMETFDAIPTLTGVIKVMVPRILHGTLQVFAMNVSPNWFMTNKYVFIKRDVSASKISKKRFKEQMEHLIVDDEDLMAKISSGELGYKDLLQIVQMYNTAHPVTSD